MIKIMKKFIFIVFAIFAFGSAFAGNDNSIGAKASSAVSTVYDDGKEVVTTVYNDSKDLIKSAYPEVKEAVKAIAYLKDNENYLGSIYMCVPVYIPEIDYD